MNRIFISVERVWFTKHLGEELGLIYDCCITEITEQSGAVKLLESVFRG